MSSANFEWLIYVVGFFLLLLYHGRSENLELAILSVRAAMLVKAVGSRLHWRVGFLPLRYAV